MDKFLLIGSLLRLVGIAAQNPVIGASADVIKYAGALAAAAETGRLTIEELKAESNKLKALITENRAPTTEELQALKSLSDSLSARIQA